MKFHVHRIKDELSYLSLPRSQAVPTSLQVIKNWRREQPGNKAISACPVYSISLTVLYRIQLRKFGISCTQDR